VFESNTKKDVSGNFGIRQRRCHAKREHAWTLSGFRAWTLTGAVDGQRAFKDFKKTLKAFKGL